MKSNRGFFSRSVLCAVFMLSMCLAAGAQAPKPPKTILGGVVNGKALTLPKPDYPDDARKAKLSGSVKVEVLIDESGKVLSAKAIAGLENVSLRIAAETAALNATFSPTRLSGQPVKVSGVIVYNFVAEKSKEEKLKVLGVSVFLTIVRSFASDLGRFKEAFDEKDLFKDDIADFGEFGPELKALESIEKLPVDKRLEAVDTALSSVRSKLTESDRWQFDVGKNLGEMIGPMMWLVSTNGPDGLSKLDGAGLRLNLNKIRDLTLSAPPDFPKDVLAKFKDLTAVGGKDNLQAPENLKDFFDKLEALFDVISPGSTD